MEYIVRVIHTVVLSRSVAKGLRKLPQHVAEKLHGWVAAVEAYGLEEVRKVPGYHDEPLRGERAGQRSIRLSKAYRALYRVEQDRVEVEYVHVFEVNKHDY